MSTASEFGGDRESIQGAWRMVRGGEKGRTLDEAEVRGRSLKMFFSDDDWSVKVGDDDGPKAKFQLDVDAQPRGISLTTENGKTLPGIYRLRGDELTIMLAGGPGPRPTQFETEASTEENPSPNHRLYVLKRSLEH